MDGGSSDGSVDIIQRVAGRLAYWTSQPDRGQTDALIKGFARATGEIFCWLNSDDLLEPGALQDVAAFFRSHAHARAVYGDATWIDVDGQPLKPKKEHPFNKFIWLFDHNFIPQPSTFWRRDLYEEVGGLDSEFHVSMDADLWIRFAQVAKIHHVKRRWSRMRFHAAQKVQRLQTTLQAEDVLIRRRYLTDERSWRRNRVLARGMRVAWKFAMGAYW
jgi:glycosyltransferase involved in cell wall biosynthesis